MKTKDRDLIRIRGLIYAFIPCIICGIVCGINFQRTDDSWLILALGTSILAGLIYIKTTDTIYNEDM